MPDTRPTLSQPIIDLYDRFTHGGLDRRAFMERLATLAGGGAAASALLPLLQNNYALAETVPEADPRLEIGTWSYAGPDGTMQGYLARPKDALRRPAVLVIHENRGLNPHIKDVTRRFAVAGYLAFGVDALSIEGGTPADEDKARDLFGTLDAAKTAARLAAAVPALAAHPASTGKVGAVGFCWGGGMVNQVAVLAPDLAAGVAYYGLQPPAARVPAIRAALLLHYAGNDERIDAGIAAYREALSANGKTFEIHVYEGVQHAFNNDTNPARYDAKAAALANERTLSFLARYLGAPPKLG